MLLFGWIIAPLHEARKQLDRVLLLLLLPLLVAAKVYKWTDEQGVIHYTNTPPPTDQQEEELTVPDTGERVKVEGLNGSWWIIDHGKPRKLRLTTTRFEIHDYRQSRRSRLYADGSVMRHNKRLILTYFEAPDHPELQDQQVTMLIIQLSDRELSLMDEQGNTRRYVRFDDANAGGSPGLHGHWLEDNGQRRLEFQKNRFDVQRRSGSGWRDLASGNWQLPRGRDTLKLFFVTDFDSPDHRRLGTTERFTVVALTESLLELDSNGIRRRFERDFGN